MLNSIRAKNEGTYRGEGKTAVTTAQACKKTDKMVGMLNSMRASNEGTYRGEGKTPVTTA